MGSFQSLIGQLDPQTAIAAIAVVVCAVFLSGLVLGCVVTFAAAWRITASWSHSPTQGHAVRVDLAGIDARIISALSQCGFDVSLVTMPTSASSGSSSSSDEGRHTSISSSPTKLTDSGSPAAGSKLSEVAMLAMSAPARAPNDSAAVDAVSFRTRESTLPSLSKKPCRLCSKIRRLAGFGAS